jgi:hypothetical protein
MMVGEGVFYWFLAGFPLINRPTLFFLIHENGKSFALFKKNFGIYNLLNI